MRIVAFATIKLNSERVPHKNIQPVGSKPLCYHILNTALDVKQINDVYVYCSDEKVEKYIPANVKFIKREKWLDGNEVRANNTYTAFLNDIDADLYIALCTTSPFIKKETIANSLRRVVSGENDSAFTVKKMQTFTWYNGSPINYDISNVPKTQDIKPVYVETSAFFIFSRELWQNYRRRIGFHPYMQEVGEIEGVDIDTIENLKFAQILADHVLHI